MNHKNLDAWRNSISHVKKIYEFVKKCRNLKNLDLQTK